MATGNAALLSPDIFASVRTMSATIGAEMAEVVFGDAHYDILFFIGVCLFAFSFSLNMFAEFVVRHFLLSRFGGKTR
jgi:phosphate transport system permease protein